jgi:superfamily II DNA/RNA helicase
MKSLKPVIPLSVAIQFDHGVNDDINNLLNNCTPKNKQIDLIARHFDAIIDARQRKITWDAIGATLNVSRSTLINAIKAIKDRRSNKSSNLCLSQSLHRSNAERRLIDVNDRHSIKETNESILISNFDSCPGIKVLGRAQIHNFNI